jgi:MFS family permease
MEPESEQIPSHWDRLPYAFDSLKYRNYRMFWSGQLISLIGLWMQTLAQGWLVYELTASKFLLGLINAIAGLPVLLLTPAGGIIADHVNKKKLLLFTQVMFSILSFLIGLLISLKWINFENLAFLVFFIGVINAIDSPTRQAFVVELVNKRVLGNAIALNSLAFNSARILGPALAGYIIGITGVEACFYFNAITFFAVIWGLLLVRGDFGAKAEMGSTVRQAFFDGLSYIFKDEKVLFSLILVAFSSLFAMPYAVLMPVFAKDILKVGAQGLGILMAFSGLGALIAAFVLAQFSKKIDLKKLILASTFVMSAALILFSFSLNFYLSCLMLALLGWGIVSQSASVNTFIQHEVPNELRGRIMGFYTLCFMGFMPIGAFQAGITSHFFGAPIALAIGGVACLIPAAFMVFYFDKMK